MTSAAARSRALPAAPRIQAPRIQARIAGLFYLVAVVTAVIAEFIIPGRMGLEAVVIPIACYAVVTLLLYFIFKPGSPALCLLATACGFAGLAFEALRWQPNGVNLGMTFHAFFCILIGCAMFRSLLLPRAPGAAMAFAGLVWLAYLFPALADRLAPYNSAIGLLAEATPMIWLLFAGVSEHRPGHTSSTPEVAQ